MLNPLIASAKSRFPKGNYVDTRTRAGLSLVEVMIALALLATVISALMGTLGNAASVNTTADLRERAVTASHRYIEQIQEANSLYTIYQTFADKPFDVPGLVPPAGRARVGRIYIPTYYAAPSPTTVAGPMPVMVEVKWRTSVSTSDVFAVSYIAVPR